jgi:hypothetical protein
MQEEVEVWSNCTRHPTALDHLAQSVRRNQFIAKQAQMPLRGSRGDANGRLRRDARITSCPASARF